MNFNPNFLEYKPIFTKNELKILEDINKTITLEIFLKNKNLVEKFSFDFIYTSAKIEGNTYSKAEALTLLDYGKTSGGTASAFAADSARAMMASVDSSINQLNSWRSDVGSTQNQLESALRNMMTQKTNIKAAESVIRDVDYAAESANFNKQNIIAQAGTYAQSQANAIQQNVLRLLQ